MGLIDELSASKKKPGRPLSEYEGLMPHPLKEFFSVLGITQTAIARKLKISPSLLSMYLNGRLVISSKHEKMLQELADELQVEEAD